MLYWLYIDDFGAISIDQEDVEESDAEIARAKLRDRLRDLGFHVHKEEAGPKVTGIGVVLDGITFEARSVEDPLRQLVADTEATLLLRRGAPKEIERLIG